MAWNFINRVKHLCALILDLFKASEEIINIIMVTTNIPIIKEFHELKYHYD